MRVKSRQIMPLTQAQKVTVSIAGLQALVSKSSADLRSWT
jgi:hypothetical protein